MTTAPASSSAQVLAARPTEAKRLSIFGNKLRLAVTGADTGGAWSLLEYTVPPHFAGPPPHVHAHTTEGFYVLSGTLTFEVNGEVLGAPAGSVVVVPPGVAHTFRNDTDESVSFLIHMTPAGFERYFEELSDLVEQEPTWPPADMRKLEQLTAKYDQHPPTSGT